MSFTAIVTGIFAIAEAVPVVAKYIDKAFTMYVDNQLNKVETQVITKKHKRAALMKAVSKAETNVERKALSKMLHTVNIGGKL